MQISGGSPLSIPVNNKFGSPGAIPELPLFKREVKRCNNFFTIHYYFKIGFQPLVKSEKVIVNK